MEFTAWISAIAAVISLPISIWGILSSKRNSKKIDIINKNFGIDIKGNTVIGPGTILHIGDKN